MKHLFWRFYFVKPCFIGLNIGNRKLANIGNYTIIALSFIITVLIAKSICNSWSIAILITTVLTIAFLKIRHTYLTNKITIDEDEEYYEEE